MNKLHTNRTPNGLTPKGLNLPLDLLTPEAVEALNLNSPPTPLMSVLKI